MDNLEKAVKEIMNSGIVRSYIRSQPQAGINYPAVVRMAFRDILSKHFSPPAPTSECTAKTGHEFYFSQSLQAQSENPVSPSVLAPGLESVIQELEKCYSCDPQFRYGNAEMARNSGIKGAIKIVREHWPSSLFQTEQLKHAFESGWESRGVCDADGTNIDGTMGREWESYASAFSPAVPVEGSECPYEDGYVAGLAIAEQVARDKFATELMPEIKRLIDRSIQLTVREISDAIPPPDDLETLKWIKHRAVKRKQFETAAKIRDIEALLREEQKLKGGKE